MDRRTLRILQVSTIDIIGGASKVAWNLFQDYRSRGHDSWLAVSHKYSDDANILLIPNDVHRSRWARICLAAFRPLALLEGKIRGVGRLRNAVRWIGEPRRWLEHQRGYEDFHFPGTWHLIGLTPKPPDIVHCHNLHGGYFDLRALPWLSQQVPVVLTLHDAWLLSGHCACFFNCERWKIGCGNCPDLTIYPAVRQDKTAYNWQRKRNIFESSRLYISTPSQWLMDKVQESMLRGVQYRVIPNGIDLSVFRPGSQAEARRALNLPDNAKIVLLIAHNMFKDYDTMEAALRQLDRRDNTELLFICLGKTGADRVVGQGRMFYHGFERNQERMALYYRASDVFIHAAKDETFGKTVTEARACGTPVVATAVGGIPEQLTPLQITNYKLRNPKSEIRNTDATGVLVPQGDADGMAEGIVVLLTNNALRRQLIENAARDVCNRFDLNRQVEAYLTWYQEIIEDWRKTNKSNAPNFG